jgi:hypothetical protein
MLSNGDPIPVHFPTDVVTATTYTVPGQLGCFLASPTGAATWTLPSLASSSTVQGAPLWISNRSTLYTITLTPAAGETISGPSTVPPGYTLAMITDGTVAWKTTGTSEINGGLAPTAITVNAAATADNVSVFNTIQAAFDSLSNKSTQNTTITLAAGTYAESVTTMARITATSPTTSTTVVINGDSRSIVGCGIAHDYSWNRSGPASVGGVSTTSKAVLSGTSGGFTLSVTASPGTNPDFIVAGVVAGDRVAIRHNQGVSPQFAIYTVAEGGVAATVLTFTAALAGDVNALGAAMCVVPNVEWAPPSGNTALTPRGVYLALNGIYYNLQAGGVGINGQRDTFASVNRCLFYGGNMAFSVNGGCYIRTDTSAQGCTYFASSSSLAVADLFGFGFMRFANSVIAPNNGTRSCFADVGSLCQYSATISIGGGCTDGFIHARRGSRIIMQSGNTVVCSSNIGVGVFEDASLSIFQSTEMAIRSTAAGGPSTALAVSSGSQVSATSGIIALDCATAASSFVGLQIGAFVTSTLASGVRATFNLRLAGIPASALIARVSTGSSLVIGSVTTEASAVGLDSNGFIVENGSFLAWGDAATLVGGGGTGVLFDINGGSTLSFRTVATPRQFSGYGTIFKIDRNSNAYITSVTTTTSNAGANTNLLVTNGSRATLGAATFVVSGSNIGISMTNGGSVVREAGTTLTNGAATPVLGPTVGTATGDLITPTISATSTDLSGVISASTTAGGSAGGLTLTFSAAFAVAPVVTLTAQGAAAATALRVVSVSTTAAVLACVTPAGGGTAFSIAYQVASGL